MQAYLDVHAFSGSHHAMANSAQHAFKLAQSGPRNLLFIFLPHLRCSLSLQSHTRQKGVTEAGARS